MCGITKYSYLKVFLNLLEVSESSSLDKTQLGEILTDCYQAVQACSFNQQLLDKDLAIIQLKLLLWCLSHDLCTYLEVIEGSKLEPVGFLKMCLCDGQPLALRTFCLEFINTTAAPATFSDDVITEHVFGSLCSESDPDYLIQVYNIYRVVVSYSV